MVTVKKNNEYTVAIVGAIAAPIFTAITTAIYDFAKEKPILSTFKGWLNWIWVYVLGYELKIWQILLLLIFLTLLYTLYQKTKKPSNISRNKPNPLPLWLNYTEDEISGLKLKWDWELNPIISKWQIQNLRIVCNRCGTLMHHTPSTYIYSNSAECPRCNNTIQNFKELDKVEAIIIDNVRRGLFKNIG